MHSHTVHLALSALLMTCTMCGTQTSATERDTTETAYTKHVYKPEFSDYELFKGQSKCKDTCPGTAYKAKNDQCDDGGEGATSQSCPIGTEHAPHTQCTTPAVHLPLARC